MITSRNQVVVAMITFEQAVDTADSGGSSGHPNEPPSQKSRCGSAMIKARFISQLPGWPAITSPTAGRCA
jgi:hypothetical protein